MTRLYAYKIMETNEPEKHPVGRVFLLNESRGRRHTFCTYNRETLRFEELYTARYLGPITARTDAGKVKQLLALPGTSHLRRKSVAA